MTLKKWQNSFELFQTKRGLIIYITDGFGLFYFFDTLNPLDT